MTDGPLVRGTHEPLLTGNPPPANILPSLQRWIAERFWIGTPEGIELDSDRFREMERKLGVSVVFDQTAEEAAARDCLDRVARSEDFAALVVTILLPSCSGQATVELAEIFDAPG